MLAHDAYVPGSYHDNDKRLVLAADHRSTFTRMNKSSAAAEMGDRGHNRHGLKRGEGAVVPFSRRELGSHQTQSDLG